MGQTVNDSLYDILVVNNHADTAIHEELKRICGTFNNCSIIQETQSGLSRARNTGYHSVHTEWVGYIDDDCLAPNDFVENILDIIEEDQFDCFGGHITSWWWYDRPRWLNPDFGSKPMLTVDMSMIEEDYNWGGNMFFKRDALVAVNGFDESVGMNANKIGYSAENRVQQRLREKGYKIGYDPNLIIQHLVGKHKLHPNWHIKAAYAEGRDAREVFPEQYTALAVLKDLIRLPRIWYNDIASLTSRPDYYWQNAYIDSLKPVFRLLGKLRSFFK